MGCGPCARPKVRVYLILSRAVSAEDVTVGGGLAGYMEYSLTLGMSPCADDGSTGELAG